MSYLQYFFNLRHLFNLRPEAMTQRAIIILTVIFGLLLILGIAAKMIQPKTKDGLKIKGYRRLTHLGLAMGILGFVYLFFAWQGVALLAARFWLLLWAISLAVWGAFIAKYLLKDVPKLRRDIENKRKFDKYIP
jgi:hypothetical protein